MNNNNLILQTLIGFERLLKEAEDLQVNRSQPHYPPFNIIKLDSDSYLLELAVTGFSLEEISVTTNQQKLIIKAEKEKTAEREYIHRGLSSRNFEKIFPLTDYMEVKEAVVKNGLLSILVERVLPESLKPKLIEVKG